MRALHIHLGTFQQTLTTTRQPDAASRILENTVLVHIWRIQTETLHRCYVWYQRTGQRVITVIDDFFHTLENPVFRRVITHHIAMTVQMIFTHVQHHRDFSRQI